MAALDQGNAARTVELSGDILRRMQMRMLISFMRHFFLRLKGRLRRGTLLVEEENKAVRVLQLLTQKPLTYAANVGEGDLTDDGESNSQVQALKKKALEENCEVVVVSAQVRS